MAEEVYFHLRSQYWQQCILVRRFVATKTAEQRSRRKSVSMDWLARLPYLMYARGLEFKS